MGRKTPLLLLALAGLIVVAVLIGRLGGKRELPATLPSGVDSSGSRRPSNLWIDRAYAVDGMFHAVYTPCWEGAYGAIGDAYLFTATGDSNLLNFHLRDHDLRSMCVGTWVDDRAWVCLAELIWWDRTGRTRRELVQDAAARYLEARRQGRLSHHEGFWSWYNWPPGASVDSRIFTNGAMNQMATVACWLYEATGDRTFLHDAMLVWGGDAEYPGVVKTLYRGRGIWEGRPGLAAFGKQIAWGGAEYCAVGAALFRATKDPKIREVVVATARHLLDPSSGWVDPVDFYQIHMDGNGAFVNYLLDAYEIAPDELPDVPVKVGLMLDHVWTNHGGRATLVLHRESDHGIRNGWNPNGGEDGYNVDEVGTVHAQGEAARAFGMFACIFTLEKRTAAPETRNGGSAK